MCLYLHDPYQMDKDIDQKLEQAKMALKALESKPFASVHVKGRVSIFNPKKIFGDELHCETIRENQERNLKKDSKKYARDRITL